MAELRIPVKYINVDGTEEITYTDVNLVETTVTETGYVVEQEDQKFISSIEYVPDFQQNNMVFEDAAKLLDILVNADGFEKAVKDIRAYYQGLIDDLDPVEQAEEIIALEIERDAKIESLTKSYNDTLKEINQAYLDTLYKYSDYNKLSYSAKITVLQELGFDYVLDLLLHMYDYDYKDLVKQYKRGEIDSIPSYDDYVESMANNTLTKLVNLFNIINILKGKTVGLELVLELVFDKRLEYLYMPWNIIANKKGVWNEDKEKLPKPGGKEVVKPGDYYVHTTDTGTTLYYIFNGVSWHQTTVIEDYETPREPLTAVLEVYGVSTPELQKTLSNFTKHYMLPLIDVTLKFDAQFPYVYGFPSGVYDLLNTLDLYDYYKGGLHLQHDLVHKVSDEYWHYAETSFPREDLFFGKTLYEKNFAGMVDLKKSFVEDKEGNRYYMYSNKPQAAEEISGTAQYKIEESGNGNITYDGDYLQVSLEDYIEIDFVTGEQQNPHYEGDLFVRDTIIKNYHSLTIEQIHLKKTVYDMEQLHIEDFDREYIETEVYLGKETTVKGISGYNHRHGISETVETRYTEMKDDFLAEGITQYAIRAYVDYCKIIDSNESSYYEKYNAERSLNELIEPIDMDNYNYLHESLTTLSHKPVIDCSTVAKTRTTIKDCKDKYGASTWTSKYVLTVAEYKELSGVRQVLDTAPSLSGSDLEDMNELKAIIDKELTLMVKNPVKTGHEANKVIADYLEIYKYSDMLPLPKLTTPQMQEVLGVLYEVEPYLTFNKYQDLTALSEIKELYTLTFTEPSLRANTGEEEHFLKYCEAELDENYTGIGDLGILGANDYFIYNGMLFYHNDGFKQIGESKKWMDVGASHAVSEMYYTPAINNGNIFYLYEGEVNPIERDINQLDSYVSYIVKHPQIVVDALEKQEEYQSLTVEEVDETIIRTYLESWFELDPYWDEIETKEWTAITGYMNEFYTAFGICGGRLYKIYLNPEYGNVRPDGTPEPLIVYQIMDDNSGWTYITGADYSETYEAYGIRSGRLFRITSEGISEVKRTNTAVITGVENVSYTKTEEGNFTTLKAVYKTHFGENTTEKVEVVLEKVIPSEDFPEYTETYLRSIKFNDVAQDITDIIENEYTTANVTVQWSQWEGLTKIMVLTNLYKASILLDSNTVDMVVVNTPASYVYNELGTIEGWDGSFDCISRYHHCNSDYTTYGIAEGVLYSINSEEVKILDNTKVWTAVCGYYNENSPRTFGYGIAGGKLYELKGTAVPEEYKNTETASMVWTEIHGCITATNNFVIGIAKTSDDATSGYIYKINAKTLSKLDTSDTADKWTHCFGRYTTSTAASNNCYGYGVKNNKLYQFNKNNTISIVSGFWKEDGEGPIVDLSDYNIETITANMPSGIEVSGVDNIKEIVPSEGLVVEDFDIFITYVTRGFDNNERYQIRTELSETNYTYINPEQCRDDVSELNCEGLFNNNTGLMTGFITKNVEVIGAEIIEGNGNASGFSEKQSYIVIPETTGNQIISTNISFTVPYADDGLYPIILDNNKNGFYYGKNGDNIGLFVKHTYGTTLVKEMTLEDLTAEVKFAVNGDTCNLFIKGNEIYSPISISGMVNNPIYLGGDGSIFGDAVIHLLDSYVQMNDRKLYLFENGKYFSLKTKVGESYLDLVEYLETAETQATQQVIELKKEDGEILELSMDKLYTQFDVECLTNNLDVSTDYNYNVLRSDRYEGTTYATLEYTGKYILDPEVITSNVPLNTVCDFDKTGIASNLNTRSIISFELNLDFTDPIKIKTGSRVENQRLYKTEEGEAYTNKYLLQSNVTKVSDVACTAVPSGIIYEMNSNEPKTVSRTLVYNNDSFEIDEEKITHYSSYWFDTYNATMQFYPQIETVEIIDPETGDITYEQVYVDAFARILMDLNAERNNDVITASKDIKVKVTSTEEQDLFNIADTMFKTHGAGDYYYHFDITKTFVGLNDSIMDAHDDEPEPKDKLQYKDGQCWNFSEDSYLTLNHINAAKGFLLCVIMDDDASKDQGIIGSSLGGFGIKDNRWTYTDATGTAHKTNVIVKDFETTYIRFDVENSLTSISLSSDGENFETLIEGLSLVADSVLIGKGNVSGEVLAYNGTIDLAQSFELETKERLYLMSQKTKVSESLDGETYTLLDTVETAYSVSYIGIGHEFTGTLDCYYSDLLISRELGWVENRVKIDTVIKREMQQADPSYNPETDDNIYGITEYGINLNAEPKRWNTITVTYTTVDKAFYMQPNTEYELCMDVSEDLNTGNALVDINGTMDWSDGLVSNFENGYLSMTLPSSGYTVLKLNMTTEDQAICSFYDEADNTPPCIYIEGGMVKYFNNIISKDLFEAFNGTVYIKLPADYGKPIEYSLDGEVYQSTGVVDQFLPLVPLAIGKGHIDGTPKTFKGSIDLSGSYTCIGGNVNYLFKHYKSVTPYIKRNGVRYELVLTPLLTVKDTITFAFEFDGSIYMEDSGLTQKDTKHWTANQITIYDYAVQAKRIAYDSTLNSLVAGHIYENGDKFNCDGKSFLVVNSTGLAIRDVPESISVEMDETTYIASTLIVDTVIRDALDLEPCYIKEETNVIVNPDELFCYISGKPSIGSKVLLTYNTWYLFREKNTLYEFKVNYIGNKTTLSFKKSDTATEIFPEYTIYITDKQEFIVNTGYQFNGTLIVKDSTRGGMVLCDYRVWYTYTIKYKKYNAAEWNIWTEFILENTTILKQRCGYDLLGVHYLPSSWLKTFKRETPFVSFYNSTYIYPVGGISFTPDGKAYGFSETAYLGVRMDNIEDGYKVSFFANTDDNENQGVCTFVNALNGYFLADDGTILNKFRPNYNYIIQYIFGGYGLTVEEVDRMSLVNLESKLIKMFAQAENTITVRILGYSVGENPYEPTIPKPHTVTIIPYNPEKHEDSTGYYILNSTQASKVHLSYRKVEHSYDRFTEEGEDVWYDLPLEKMTINYFGKTLEVYATKVSFGCIMSATVVNNSNKDEMIYYEGDVIEVKAKSVDKIAYMNVIPYNNLIKKVRAVF